MRSVPYEGPMNAPSQSSEEQKRWDSLLRQVAPMLGSPPSPGLVDKLSAFDSTDPQVCLSRDGMLIHVLMALDRSDQADVILGQARVRASAHRALLVDFLRTEFYTLRRLGREEDALLSLGAALLLSLRDVGRGESRLLAIDLLQAGGLSAWMRTYRRTLSEVARGYAVEALGPAAEDEERDRALLEGLTSRSSPPL